MHRRGRRFSQHFHLLNEDHEPGAPQGLDRDAWSDRCCGLACLRILLDRHRLPVPTQTSLLRRALEIGAFSGSGMIHHKLVELAHDHGLSGSAVPVTDVAALARLGDAGFPSIVSVTHRLPEDGRRGGHLVVLAGTVADGPEMVRFVDPSRWGDDHDRVPRVRLAASYSGRAVLLWPGGAVPSAVEEMMQSPQYPPPGIR